jgi:hypothetical protein
MSASPTPARPWAPLLAAWYLALSLLAELGGAVDRRDGIGTLVYATITAILASFLSGVLTRDGARRSLCATVLVLWAGLFGTFRLILTSRVSAFPLGDPGILLAWTSAFGLLIILVIRSRPPMENVVKALTVALAMLVVLPTLGHARRLWESRPPRQADPGTWSIARDSTRPDIYIILADMFGSPEVVRAQYGLDLRWFVDSLRSLGFVVPANARTNYVHTGLVLPTMLHSRLVHEEIAADGVPVWDAATTLIQSAPVWQELQRNGYRLVFFPTHYPPTSRLPAAALVLKPPVRSVQRVGQTWLFNTPIDLILTARCAGDCTWNDDFPHPIETGAAWQWKLGALASLPDSAGPIATFMHFLGSHEPFVFREDCTPRDPWWPRSVKGPDSLLAQRAYADQLECVSRLILTTVSTIIAGSAVSPVIIIQGDHGNGGIRTGSTLSGTVSVDEASQAQLNDRLRVFGAYRFPGARAVVYDSITPVNVLSLALSSVFGDEVIHQPDRTFWSTWLAPLELTEVGWSGDSVVIRASRRDELR